MTLTQARRIARVAKTRWEYAPMHRRVDYACGEIGAKSPSTVDRYEFRSIDRLARVIQVANA